MGPTPAGFSGGPADEAVLDLPAKGSYTSSGVRLLVDGVPAKYFVFSGSREPGQPRIYCWDDPDDASLPHHLQMRIAEALRGH